VRTISFLNEYKIVGSEQDQYYQRLPGHDLSSLYTFISRHREQIAPKAILDVGANIGLSALCFHDVFPLAGVEAFEPSRVSGSFCEINLENARQTIPGGAMTLHRCAVGAAEGRARFVDDESYLAGSALGDGPGAYDVPMTSIDEFCRTRGAPAVGFIKIDVEGLEIEVLKGAAKTIARCDPVVFFEFNPWVLYKGGVPAATFLSEAEALLGPLGYVEALSGLVHPLPSGGDAAAAALEAAMTEETRLFDLVNRPDIWGGDKSRPGGPPPS